MDLSYTLIRSPRKTISIVIKPSGEVEVRCPKRCSKREADAFVQSKRDWIEKHLSAMAEKPALPVLQPEEIRALANRAAEILPGRVQYFARQMGVS